MNSSNIKKEEIDLKKNTKQNHRKSICGFSDAHKELEWMMSKR